MAAKPWTAKQRAEHRAQQRAWHLGELDQVLAGERSPTYGAKACSCKRRLPCATCGDGFVCWSTWDDVWRLMPPHVRRTKVCRRCYGEWLLLVLEDRAARNLPLLPRAQLRRGGPR